MKILLKDTLKKNNGYTGVDLSVSAIVILISISVIAAMFYNLYFAGTGMKRNVIATDYAINILETIQATEYSKVTFKESNKLKTILDTLLKTEGTYDSTTDTYTAITSKINNNYDDNYKIEVIIEKYSDRFNTGEKEDYIKIITVKIQYNLGKNNTEILEISTLKTIN